MSRIIAVWEGNGWIDIIQRDDGLFNQVHRYLIDGSRTVDEIIKDPVRGVRFALGTNWRTKEEFKLVWDDVFYQSLGNPPIWPVISTKIENKKCISRPSTDTEKQKLAKFFMGRENTEGCECGAWTVGGCHSSWCRCYKSEVDPKVCYSPTFDYED